MFGKKKKEENVLLTGSVVGLQYLQNTPILVFIQQPYLTTLLNTYYLCLTNSLSSNPIMFTVHVIIV